jgi:hypothetical protein
MPSAQKDLETRIGTEIEAARAAIRLALTHAARAGDVIGELRDLMTQSEFNVWVGAAPADRHTIMVMRRVATCDALDTKAQTLADLMFDRAALYIAEGATKRSRSEQLEISRARLQKETGQSAELAEAGSVGMNSDVKSAHR